MIAFNSMNLQSKNDAGVAANTMEGSVSHVDKTPEITK